MGLRRRLIFAAALAAAPLAVGISVAAADLVAGEWSRFEGGPGTTCADGSEPMFLERQADPSKVVLYLEGGGGCWSIETCTFDGAGKAYVSSSDIVPDLLTDRGGIFDAEHPENPVAGFSFVYVPYCTGDVHLGTATYEYAPDLVVEHKGFYNSMAGLEHLVANYPDAEEVLVTGPSAGSVPTPLLGALIADRLPSARVVTLGDSSGAYPDDALLNVFVGLVWGTEGAIPDWPETADIGLSEWSMPGLYVFAGQHAPDVTYARFDYAYDAAQAERTSFIGIDADDLVTLIDQNEATVEASGTELVSYVAPGTGHTLIDDDTMYALEVGGVRFRDWFSDLLSGETPADVRCVDCGKPPGS